MGKTKRQRQKMGRQARIEAARAAQRRAKRLRTIRNFLIFAAAVVVAGFVFAAATGDDDEDVETAGTTTTSSDTTTTTTTPEQARDFHFGTTACPAADGSSPQTLEFSDAFQLCIDPTKTYTAVFETTEGDIRVQLDTTTTPGTSNNFVSLARHHYYDGTEIFRTDPSIGIIQGGSPHTQDASDPGPGYSLADEGFDYTAIGGQGGPYHYHPGDLVMARSSQPNGAGAQYFFAVTDAVSALESQGVYVKFGTTVEGLEVLEAILALHQADDSGLGGGPSRTVTVERVTIEESETGVELEHED